MVAGLLVSLPAGAWVDRVDKRRLMLVCDLTRAVAQGLLAAAIITKHADLVVILLASLATVPFSSLFGIAEDPTVRHVVSTEQLPLALARNQARGSAAALCGPPLGGALFVIDPALPVAVDAATFLFSFCCMALMRTPTPAAADARDSAFVATILSGLRFVWGQAFLRVTLLQISGLNVASNALFIAAIVISQEHGHEATTGLLLAMGGIGSILGALVAPRLVRRLRVRTILIANRLIWAALIPLFLIIDQPIGLGAIFAALFFIGPTGNTALVTAEMAVTPEHMQGRVSSARGFVAGLAAPLGASLIGLSLQHLGRTTSILALATFMLLLAGIVATSRAIRRSVN
jgi:predicted MFS family arabinose efflux permease